MKTLINDDFILHSKTASRLYHKYAADMPIFDYHCHLSPKEIYDDKRFLDLTDIWLTEDHYKWRLMRANGVDEKFITGDSDNYAKFMKWAETVPKCMGNPVFHWTHLELKRFFDIDEILSPETAAGIWDKCNEKLQEDGFSARELLKRSNVKALCTADDPVDDLKYHMELAKDEGFNVKVFPTFRPERVLNPEPEGFRSYIERLSMAAGMDITCFEELIAALRKRAEFFKSAGCFISDQSFNNPDFSKSSLSGAQAAFKKAMNGQELSCEEEDVYKTELMIALGRIYNDLGFCMQLHAGVIRNLNSRMYKTVGLDAGFDAMGDGISAKSLACLLDALNRTDELPKTIIYCLNGNDNDKITAVIGCFQSAPIPGKLQIGSAWWFNDHLDGMRQQMKTLGNIGLLSRFIGMLTDSRSFLSYPRHEYFRRILCDMIGEWAEKGEVPMDYELLGSMVKDICFNNAVKYFNFNM